MSEIPQNRDWHEKRDKKGQKFSDGNGESVLAAVRLNRLRRKNEDIFRRIPCPITVLGKGVVKEIKGSIAAVELTKTSQCSHCGICLVGKNSQTMVVELENNIKALVGDRVSVSIQGASILIASFLVYIVPLICFIIALVISYIIAQNNQIYMVLSGVAGLGFGFLISKMFDLYFKKKKKIQMVMTKINLP